MATDAPQYDYVRNGPWRDGRQLVVRLDDTELPDYCLKTNQPTGGATETVRLERTRNYLLLVLLLGAIGHAIAKSQNTEGVTVSLPLSEEWRQKRRRRKQIGWAIVIAGVLALFGGMYGYSKASVSGAVAFGSGFWYWLSLSGAVVALVAAFYLVFVDRSGIKLVTLTDEYVWLSGAHPDFLGRFPSWKA
jgi:hypothetical protein